MTDKKTAATAWAQFTDKFCSIGYDPAEDVSIIEKTLNANTWHDIDGAPRDGSEFLGHKETWMRPRIMRRTAYGFESVTDSMPLKPTHYCLIPPFIVGKEKAQ